MNNLRGVFVAGCVLILLTQAATTVRADSVTQPKNLIPEPGSKRNVGVNSLPIREANEFLGAVHSYSSGNTAVFSTKRMRSSVDIVTTGFAVQGPGFRDRSQP
jgi:hypothetical protein